VYTSSPVRSPYSVTTDHPAGDIGLLKSQGSSILTAAQRVYPISTFS
jgi:hypothetical protein